MPLPSVHFRLGALALELWATDPRRAPFDLGSTVARNAYWQGTLGPDTGLFPGGVPVFAQLAHRERAGELTRRLIAAASGEVERAFAWGWLTHVLADVAIHPVVNRCAARLVAAGGGDPRDAAALAAAHSRLEIGLDVHVLLRDPGVRRIRLRHAFDAGTIGYLLRAYESTYAREFERAALLRSHRAVTRMANALALLERVHGLAAPGPRGGAWRRGPLRALGRLAGAPLDTLSRAFLEPVPPPRPLLASLRETASGFRALMRRHQLEKLAQLGDPDLDGLPAALAPAA